MLLPQAPSVCALLGFRGRQLLWVGGTLGSPGTLLASPPLGSALVPGLYSRGGAALCLLAALCDLRVLFINPQGAPTPCSATHTLSPGLDASLQAVPLARARPVPELPLEAEEVLQPGARGQAALPGPQGASPPEVRGPCGGRGAPDRWGGVQPWWSPPLPSSCLAPVLLDPAGASGLTPIPSVPCSASPGSTSVPRPWGAAPDLCPVSLSAAMTMTTCPTRGGTGSTGTVTLTAVRSGAPPSARTATDPLALATGGGHATETGRPTGPASTPTTATNAAPGLVAAPPR